MGDGYVTRTLREECCCRARCRARLVHDGYLIGGIPGTQCLSRVPVRRSGDTIPIRLGVPGEAGHVPARRIPGTQYSLRGREPALRGHDPDLMTRGQIGSCPRAPSPGHGSREFRGHSTHLVFWRDAWGLYCSSASMSVRVVDKRRTATTRWTRTRSRGRLRRAYGDRSRR
jgi:hypothetical protein